MKTIRCAFLWDKNNKAICFMVIDPQYDFLLPPQKHDLSTYPFATFKIKAKEIVHNFFVSLYHLSKAHPDHAFKLEYRIVHPIPWYMTSLNQPSQTASFVRRMFLAYAKYFKSEIPHLIVSPQLRESLKNPKLSLFKNALRQMHLVKRKRGNGYQFHLWILALHLTKTNCMLMIKRLHEYFPFATAKTKRLRKRL